MNEKEVAVKLTEVEARCKSNTHRLDNVEKRQNALDKLAESIGTNAFRNCYGLGYVKFESTTPPTVSNSNAWNGIPTDCKIYVPRASLNTYKNATNYPSSSTYTYVGY